MKNALAYLIVLIGSIAGLFAAAGFYQEASAQKLHAAAFVIREQSQARSDLLAGALPYVALAVAVTVIFATVGLVVYGLSRQQAHAPAQHIIERQIVMVITDGQMPRGDVWRRVSAEREKLLLR